MTSIRELVLEIVAEGLQFPESPVALDDGSLLFVEIARGTLSSLSDGRVDIVADLGGGPNGAALGPDGKIYVCNNGGRFQFINRSGLLFPGPIPDAHEGGSIQRVDISSGHWEVLYEACEGQRLRAPNDLVFDREGCFWFTDHGTGKADGALYYARADGTGIHRILDRQVAPNGVGLSPDGRTVYFADTHLRQLIALETLSAGEAGSRAQTVLQVADGNLFDSLAVEADGSVCIGTLINGGITVWRPDRSSEHVPVSDPMTTSLCFGGADMCDAWLTLSSSGRIARARWPRQGLRLNHQR